MATDAVEPAVAVRALLLAVQQLEAVLRHCGVTAPHVRGGLTPLQLSEVTGTP